MNGPILVLGATGNQGGAVAALLHERGHRVRALVRDPSGAPARALAERGVELLQGDLDAPSSLADAMKGASGVFSVLPYQPGDPEPEIRRGGAIVEAARSAAVPHVVYSSAAGVDQAIGIAETDAKWRIEQSLASLDAVVTVLRPTFIMETWNVPALRAAIFDGSLMMGMGADTRLQLIAGADIATFAVHAFERPGALPSPLELAGDELTMTAIADAFAAAIARPVRYVSMPYDDVRRFNPDLATLGAWLDDHGYRADIPALRHIHPGLQTFEQWLRGQFHGRE